MNRRHWLGTAVVLAAVVGCSEPAPPIDLVCENGVCVEVSVVAERVRDQLDERVVGYVALIGDAPAMAAGPARRQTDPPPLSMGDQVQVNTASVGKMFTTVVVLKSLDARRLGVDTRIEPFLPKGWERGPNIGAVTFRDLLTHRSGFRHDSGRIFSSEAAAREQVALGVKRSDRRVAEYNNINFSIVRDLLPRLDLASSGSADEWFLHRVHEDVFDPVGVTTATCTVPAAPMLYYQIGAPRAAGRTPPAGPSTCSSGGWFMTPADMFRVLRGLEDGDLLADRLKRAMDRDCLGWDVCTPTGAHWKGGGFGDDDGAGFETYFGTKAGIPAVVITNSPGVYPLHSVVDGAFSSRLLVES